MALKRQKRVVLIYDNADLPELPIQDFLPECNHIKIIIITRNKFLTALSPYHAVDVGEMQPEEASALLVSTAHIPKEAFDDHLIASIVERLDRFALAIVQAGGVIAAKGRPDQYLAGFDESTTRHSQGVDPLETNQYAAVISWETSFATLDHFSQTFLSLCSFFHHSLIPRQLFTLASSCGFKKFMKTMDLPISSTFNAVVQTLLETCNDTEGSRELKNVIASLQARSLIRISVDARGRTFFSIHPLVHRRARERLLQGEKRFCFQLAVRLASAAIDSGDKKDGQFWLALSCHVSSLLACHMKIDPRDVFAFSWLFSEVGDFAMSSKLDRSLYKELCDTLGKQHYNTLEVCYNVVLGYYSQGDFVTALRRLQKLISVYGATDRSECRASLSCRILLSHIYLHLARFDDAVNLGLELLPLFQQRFGVNADETLDIWGVVSHALIELERLDDAIQIIKETLSTFDLGLSEPPTVVTELKSKLSLAYSRQGRHEEAVSLAIQCVEILAEKWGPTHINTVEYIFDLANIYSQMGDHSRALASFTECYNVSSQCFGSAHPHSLLFLTQLAVTHFNMGEYEKAIETMREVLEEGSADSHAEVIWRRNLLREWVSL